MEGETIKHRLIRRVSLDRFYSLVTGDDDAFYKVCAALPKIIQEVISTKSSIAAERDSVLDELYAIAGRYMPVTSKNRDRAVEIAAFLLCFPTYLGSDRIKKT